VIHSLFSEFDDEVVARKVFKMDTIGDCYIVLGVIPPDSQVTSATTLYVYLSVFL